MRRKGIFCVMLALGLAFAGAPVASAQKAQEEAAPQPVVSDGVTLAKTVQSAGQGAWQVTLTLAGGGARTVSGPVDVILLLDCSDSMAAGARSGGGDAAARTTRMAAAKPAVLGFVDTLANSGMDVRVGVACYAGKADVLQKPTSLQNPQGLAAVKEAVGNLWQVAYDDIDPCRGFGGVNLERALTTGMSLVRGGGARARYLVLVGAGEASEYGAREYSSLVPVGHQRYATVEEVTAQTRDAAQAARTAVSTLFTVSVEGSALGAWASPCSGYSPQVSEVSGVMSRIAEQLTQSVQRPTVTDTVEDAFTVQSGTIQTTGGGTASLGADGRTVVWTPCPWLSADKPVTLAYTVRLNNTAGIEEDAVLPLGRGVLIYAALQEDGALKSTRADFPVPAVTYRTGTLTVTSTGLPEGTAGTMQHVGRTMVTDTAEYALEMPKLIPGYEVAEIAVEDAVYTPADFALQTGYRLPVKAGHTAVEYRYVQAQAAEWSYTVRYYRDNQLLPEYTYTATVSAASPVVTGVRDRLSELTGCYENPVHPWPYTLQRDGEELRVDYRTLPRTGSAVTVRHIYENADGAVGTLITAPETAGSCKIPDVLSPAYGGTAYMPVQASVTRMPQSVPASAGAGRTGEATLPVTQAENIPVGGAFNVEQNCVYVVEIRYVPTGSAQ